ncbi:hypothetical protein KTO58_03335 [Chitinophaga pendula]|uniref:hypothetical protein n=1 Tax=Chitinophaga TaxID=79328 RepID=UPI000BAF1C4E|nr:MULTISPECIES: hypothetical protein [Chitinophaga]ASZ14133.1 hypothetical protein CK934_25880 [Chitinophaga sp. MD30]UCJ08233.1 hypothetical protein KTO58_03335 [Chitinophaga pendula]
MSKLRTNLYGQTLSRQQLKEVTGGTGRQDVPYCNSQQECVVICSSDPGSTPYCMLRRNICFCITVEPHQVG